MPLFKDRGIVRRIQQKPEAVHLTFDDGPDALTPRVLDVLAKFNAKASFFVIGDKARSQKEILQRMTAEGHGVFSHSIDHDYRRYFAGPRALGEWLRQSLDDLAQTTGEAQKVFRPPAGILTPPLLTAAKAQKVPLVLWNHRFFDTAHAWTAKRAAPSLARIQNGDIVLLHDRQRADREIIFIETLTTYLQNLKDRGYVCKPLNNKILEAEVQP